MNKSPRIGIVGISGRMGQEIQALAVERGLHVVAGVSLTPPPEAAPQIEIVNKIENLDAERIDLIIDFSMPDVTSEVIAWCLKNKKRLVSGVTGLSPSLRAEFNQAGNSIPVFWAPNMSLGIAVLSQALSAFSSIRDFDFQIEETHHSAKKDKPSGTALLLQEKLREVVRKEPPEPLAIRGGGVFGTHRVFAFGAEETLTFEHLAMNRKVFARGAVNAALWLFTKGPGSYSMADLTRDLIS